MHTTTHNYTYTFYYLFAKFSREINRKIEITNNNIAMKNKFFKITLMIVCIITLASALGAVIFVQSVKNSDNYATFDNDKLNKVYSNLTVLDNDGNALNEAMYYKNIKQVPLSSLQKYTYMAFVSVEDKRYFEHNGIDVKRIAGALLHNVKSCSFKEGASTISQQLIKNTHLDNCKTIERKVNEMLLATELERQFTKEQILEMYLNTIYFGRNAYGIESASNVYFNKSASSLTVSESAILAGMIKAPNTYAPDKNIEKCRARRNLVLSLMKEQEIITQEQYKQAVDSQITYTPQKKIAEKTYMYYVLKEACQLLNMTECQLLNSNYTIQTFCDQKAQQELCCLARNDITTDKKGNLSNLACIVTNNFGGVVACYMRGENADCKGQVGSTFKPIAVYAPALNEKIITQASPVLDEPTNFNGYLPQNTGGYNGWTTIKNAVTKSLNVPAVKTLNALTLPTAEKYLQKLGFSNGQNLSLSLGNVEGGATPFDLARCYTSLANNGEASQLQFIKGIYSNKGQIYSAKTQRTQVFSPSATFLMTDMLLDVVNNGTAKLLKKPYQVAAKTGTVGNKDGNTGALVAGYTTEHTFVFWHKGEFNNQLTGGNAPCILASQMLDKLYKDNQPYNFAPPKGVIKLTLDKNTLEQNQQLKIAKEGLEFWFDETNKPTEKFEEIHYDYKIECKKIQNGVCLSLPKVDGGKWQLFQEIDGNSVEIPLSNNDYVSNCTRNCTFYAKLYYNGKFVYQTPKVEVYPTQQDYENNTGYNDGKGNILDFWYWR